ncbi:MAG: hypothetical protein Q4G34_07985, partial [Micrococcus sp.]|nr:hypothetical protein [Micrococcus sp.]
MTRSLAPAPLSPRRTRLTASLAVALFALTACGSGNGGAHDVNPSAGSASSDAGSAAPSSSVETATTSSVAAADRVDPTQTTEVASVSPRVLLSHDEGLTLLDPATGETVHRQEIAGFKRLNNAGNGKDVFVTTEHGWEVYSTGIQRQAHGDHHHAYESAPGMTGVTFPGDKAGHVVTHHGLTTLFADGTGAITTFESAHLDKAVPDLMPVTQDTTTTHPHHGVALELADGSLLTTQGTAEQRDTVQVLDRNSGEVRAETTDCPGVHGEAAAAPREGTDVVVLGCENGPVVYRDGAFHKVEVGEGYHRNGNLAGIASSPIVLSDRKIEGKKPAGETERPTSVALIDSRDASMRVVELGSSYWFRSLGRAEDGSAVVLTYDGEVNVIDEETGEVTAEIPAIDAWQEKAEWQQPGPILKVSGSTAYVTDAENRKLVVVDLASGTVEREVELEFAPVEMAVVTGEPESTAGAAGAAGGGAASGDGHGGHGEHEGRDEHEGHEDHENHED